MGLNGALNLGFRVRNPSKPPEELTQTSACEAGREAPLAYWPSGRYLLPLVETYNYIRRLLIEVPEVCSDNEATAGS